MDAAKRRPVPEPDAPMVEPAPLARGDVGEEVQQDSEDEVVDNTDSLQSPVALLIRGKGKGKGKKRKGTAVPKPKPLLRGGVCKTIMEALVWSRC